MIRGSVNQDLEAVIVIDVEDINGAAHSLEVVLDTGFTGYLVLPPSIDPLCAGLHTAGTAYPSSRAVEAPMAGC